jgi:hypothetical protein
MTWFKDNPFLTALLAVALIGTGATAFLASSAAARLATAETNLANNQRTLTALQKNKPFPNPCNVEKFQQVVDAYSTEVAALLDALAAKEPPLEPITPQAFQDNLRDAVDTLRATALSSGTILPEQFFYGFDAYQTRLPADAEAPRLNREFSIIRTITDAIVSSGAASIDTLERTPTQPADPDTPQPPYTIDPFTLSFTATSNKVRNAVNTIAGASEFLIIRSLSLRNTNPDPPAKSAEPTTPAAPVSSFPFDDAPLPGTLEIVLGKELVQATLAIEILDFPNPPTNDEAADQPAAD